MLIHILRKGAAMVRRRHWLFLSLPVIALGMSVPVSAEPARSSLPPDARADFILIEKTKHRMTLFADGHRLRVYKVALGRGGLAPKMREGDSRVPEGHYRIDGRNPHSAFFLSLHISYPDAADASRAYARGDEPGGNIMIHGIGNGLAGVGNLHRRIDWTAGCIAVTDREMQEIWSAVPDGTPVDIRH